ncbi:MAG: hypothetical protein HGB28_03505 [Oscillochloris sp.]|nr:hypothetical protein [Oscillochloris sp.]
MGLFAEVIPPQLDMIAAALANDDCQQINRDAHRMRGSCLQIGALEMATLCNQLEHADHIDEAAILAPQLRTCYDATLALIRQRYPHV